VKSLTVTEDAYGRLRALRSKGESFSDVILRLTERPALALFAGTISSEDAARLRAAIRKDRKRREQLDRVTDTRP